VQHRSRNQAQVRNEIVRCCASRRRPLTSTARRHRRLQPGPSHAEHPSAARRCRRARRSVPHCPPAAAASRPSRPNKSQAAGRQRPGVQGEAKPAPGCCRQICTCLWRTSAMSQLRIGLARQVAAAPSGVGTVGLGVRPGLCRHRRSLSRPRSVMRARSGSAKQRESAC
jgi:hypothetical protein